ncbi:MAG: phospho-N-acetylmuramoyl-pentapeptide-transferase [Deltaproteobacteria bacterium]|jgi:phospho-N-acetylmuramoyl-pentapeptide-transferase|nr:phospho-N-acetylmuramoyl-pentapeptide-transferase [Deltaproteobacteria bacterium]
MFYFLYTIFGTEHIIFNVLRYITFRTVWSLMTAFIVGVLLTPALISLLNRNKCGQYIQDEVREHKGKAGTPTMGGIAIFLSMLISVLLWGNLGNPHILLCLLVFFGFGLVGLLDDWLKIKRKNNSGGLSARQKLLGQIIAGCLVTILLMRLPDFSTTLAFPFFKNLNPDLGLFYPLFALLVMIGASNGVNLTDGMDSLAIGPTIIALVCLSIFIYIAGNINFASYLQVGYVPGAGEAAVFCGALIGASLAFLWFNSPPAQIFLGDAGSLPLGASLGFLSMLCKQELVLVIMGGLFVIETLSVIMQVGYFKMSKGKRIFRMAPLHHHFQMKGIPETKVVMRFWIISIIFGLAALSTIKLR